MNLPSFDRVGVIRPLKIRDFRLMWRGMAVSLIGDGIYLMSDRFERRKLMIVADMTRGLAVGSFDVVSITGHMTLPILVVLVGLYGFGQALFYPAFGAIVPELVPDDLLVQANSLDQFARPFAYGIVGPAL